MDRRDQNLYKSDFESPFNDRHEYLQKYKNQQFDLSKILEPTHQESSICHT
jgi:hypothetical protein